jgi:hypothetical protein
MNGAQFRQSSIGRDRLSGGAPAVHEPWSAWAVHARGERQIVAAAGDEGRRRAMTQRDRVRNSTASEVNRRIREQTRRELDSLRGDPDAIRQRLDRVDAEWDVERMIVLTSAALSLVGLALRRRWLLLPVAAQLFDIQHAAQGWCPTLPVLRRLGYRTQQEIERERYTLRTMLRESVGDVHSDRDAESLRRS